MCVCDVIVVVVVVIAVLVIVRSSGSGSGLLLMDRLSNLLGITYVLSITYYYSILLTFFFGCEYPSSFAIVETFCVQGWVLLPEVLV